MIAWLLITIICACGVAAFFSVVFAIALREADVLVFILMALVVALFPVLILCTVMAEHADDLAKVRAGKALVDVRIEAIADIDKQLSALPDYSSALLNADTPVKTLVETKAQFVKDIAEAKANIAQAKVDIVARSIGPMSAVVTLLGKE